MILIAFCKHCGSPLGVGHFAGFPERELEPEYEPSHDEIKAAWDAAYSVVPGPWPNQYHGMARALKAAYAIRTKRGP